MQQFLFSSYNFIYICFINNTQAECRALGVEGRSPGLVNLCLSCSPMDSNERKDMKQLCNWKLPLAGIAIASFIISK